MPFLYYSHIDLKCMVIILPKNSQIDDGMMKFYNAVMSERRVEKRQNMRLKRVFLMPYREEKSSYL